MQENAMQPKSWWPKAAFILVALGLIFALLACATMEEKRDKYMAQGKASFEKGDYVVARLHFKNALQLDPKFAGGYLWLGKTELRLKNPQGAFGALSKAVELDPSLFEAQLILGNIYLLGKKVDEAAEKAKLVLQKEPNNVEALMLSAGVASYREQEDKTLEILKKLKALDPHYVRAYVMEALIEAKRQNPPAAAAILEEGIRVNPQAVALYQTRARLAEQQRDYEQAEALLKKAGELDPKNIQIQDELVRFYTLRRNWSKVEETLRRKVALEPDNQAHVGALARFLADQGKFDQGEKVLQDFVAKHPHDLQAKLSLATFNQAHRKLGQSARMLQEIIEKDPTGPTGIQAKGQLAVLRLGQGRQDEAERLTQEILKAKPKDITALKLDGLFALGKKDGLKAVNNFRILTKDQPQDPENWLLLARAHLVNNETQLAKEAAKKAIDLKPDFLNARKFLYGIYLQEKDYDTLIKVIKDYLRGDDKDLANWEALGDAYVLKGNDKEARAAFEKMIALQPKAPAGYMRMAFLSQKNKHSEAAVKYLETALKQNPNYHPALRLILGYYQTQGQSAKVLETARAAVAAAPKSAEIRQILGEVLLGQKQPETAVTVLEEALTLNPADRQALGLLVAAYTQVPDQKAALAKLEHKAADPQAPIFYALALAQLHERQKAPDKAIAVYEGLLARGVALALVKNNLAYFLAEHQPTAENLARAEKLALEVLDDYPEDPNLLDTAGWIYCRQGNYAKAKPLLEKAAEKVPNNPAGQYHLGFCLAKLGDAAAARPALEKALAAKGDFPQREAAQKLLDSLPAVPK